MACEPIRNIVIVGGGTAGWLSAVYLHRALSNESASDCNITLVESPDIGTIGVGEGAIVTLRRTLQFCGIDEADWMTRCNASFKMAIKFVNWSGVPGHETFWRPFDPPKQVDGIPVVHYWLDNRLQGRSDDLDEDWYASVPIAQANKAPKLANSPAYSGAAPYAYHFDAGLVAAYLANIARTRGVRHVQDTVTGVNLDERGYIRHVQTRSHGALAGDLFVDCSGFRGILINQALGEPFVPFSDSLFCDSAIALPIPSNDEQDGINPYTTATALSAGWAWRIPLYGRAGNGYVYSSAHISRDDAERELRAHVGPAAGDREARYIKMRVGMTRRAWVSNCVSIGLSCGFVEPLEATAISLIEIGLQTLAQHFPSQLMEPAVVQSYNRTMRAYYEDVRDFIVLHYCTTSREDTPFWKQNKYHGAIPDALRERLERWRDALFVSDEDQQHMVLFPSYAHLAVLLGMGRLPRRSLPIMHYRNVRAVDFLGMSNPQAHLLAALLDHYDYLRRLHSDPAPADGASTQGPRVHDLQ